MKKFTLRGKKGGEATFVFNEGNLMVEFNAGAMDDLTSLGWLLQRLPTTLAELYELRDNWKFELIEMPVDLSFDTFWKEYDFKMGSKDKCRKLYMALNDADKTLAIAKISLYKRYLTCNEGIKQVYPERYISHRRFENSFK
jgi:hypothetical protein